MLFRSVVVGVGGGCGCCCWLLLLVLLVVVVGGGGIGGVVIAVYFLLLVLFWAGLSVRFQELRKGVWLFLVLFAAVSWLGLLVGWGGVWEG